MFRRIWRWLFGAPTQIDEPDDKVVSTALTRSNFSGEDGEARNVSAEQLLSVIMDQMRDLQPKLYAHVRENMLVDGEAQDSYDDGDNYVEGTVVSPVFNGGPEAAPNISGIIVGFFLRQTFLGHQLCAMLAQHWLIAKCCWMPAQDAARKGFTISTPEGDDSRTIKMLERVDKRMKLRHNLTQFVGFGKTFGIRIVIFKVKHEDPKFYEYPFDPDSVGPGCYEGMVQVDPYWCVPELDQDATANPDSMHFYEPTWWQINGKRYHRTHLAIYREGDVADILKPAYLYGGIPVPQRVVERVYAAERTANEAPELAMAKRLITFKTDSAELLAAGPDAIRKLSIWSQLMNNFGIKVHGTDEEVGVHDTSLNDFDALTMTEYQLVAAAAEVPSTKLMGTSPKGFGASGDYEIESYHETLESLQSGAMTDLVEGHHVRAMRSYVVPRQRAIDPNWQPVEVDITWNPLDTPTATELAQINLNKSQTARNYVDIGALDGVDVRDNLIADKNSGYAGIPGAYRPNEEPKEGEVPAPQPTQINVPTGGGIYD